MCFLVRRSPFLFSLTDISPIACPYYRDNVEILHLVAFLYKSITPCDELDKVQEPPGWFLQKDCEGTPALRYRQEVEDFVRQIREAEVEQRCRQAVHEHCHRADCRNCPVKKTRFHVSSCGYNEQFLQQTLNLFECLKREGTARFPRKNIRCQYVSSSTPSSFILIRFRRTSNAFFQFFASTSFSISSSPTEVTS